MKYELKNRQFKVELMRDFNFITAKKVTELAAEADAVTIDLSRSKIVDSEAIKSMVMLINEGKSVHIVHPPEILFETMEILDLGSLINEKKIHVTYRESN